MPAHLHQLVHHLRRRIVKSRHDERVVEDLFHCACLVPLLRPDFEEPLRPRPAGLFFAEAEELRLGCGGGPGSWPCSSSRAPTPRPWHSSVLVRSGPYSLPGSLRRSSAHAATRSGAVAALLESYPLGSILHTGDAQRKVGTLESDALFLLLLLLLLLFLLLLLW